MHRHLPVKLKHFSYLLPILAIALPSRFAKAGQEVSQNLDVSVVVSPSCSVSTERGAGGAELDPACPSYARQSLVREFVVAPTQQTGQGSAVTEQLVLVINF